MAKTQEEHEATAMLLGKVYRPWAHAYVPHEGIPIARYDGWIDATTLEPLDGPQIWERLDADINGGTKPWLK